MNKNHNTFIDLFCGAGGFSYGFERAGFKAKLALDKNIKYKKTYNRNHKYKVFRELEISRETIENLPEINIDLIIGGSPCQGFSDARGCRIPRKRDDIIRNSLPFLFLKIVEYLQPKIVLFENVKGISTYKLNGKPILSEILKEFNRINYDVDWKILNSLNFGIPQVRERVFILGIQKQFNFKPSYDEFEINYITKLKMNNVKLKEVFCDLPIKLQDKTQNPSYTINYDNATNYQKILRKKSINEIFNHIIVDKPNEDEKSMIKRITQGKLYRSSRIGDKYIGVWDLFRKNFRNDERALLYFICRKRTLKEFKELRGKYQEGYIRLNKFPVDDNGKFLFEETNQKMLVDTSRTPKEIINNLLKNGWLRKKRFSDGLNNYYAYDINTKSGIRPKFRRLSFNEPSPTIQTVSFKVNELIHPIANRSITLREGARIQSFPDDFIFYGSNNEIASMIGNAVPPLMGYYIAKYITKLLEYIEIQDEETLKFDGLTESDIFLINSSRT